VKLTIIQLQTRNRKKTKYLQTKTFHRLNTARTQTVFYVTNRGANTEASVIVYRGLQLFVFP